MKRSILKFVSVFLILTLFVSSFGMFSSFAKEENEYQWSEETPFIRYEDEQGIRYKGVTGNFNMPSEKSESEKDEDKNAAIKSKGELAAVGNMPLPKSVDLGSSKYFPPIGNQGGLGSCATFSTTYYQLSYEMNRQRDVEATESNTLSPQLVYNLMSTDSTSGTTTEYNYTFLKAQGAPSMATLPYSDSDRLSWHPYEEIWKNAMDSRVLEAFQLENVGEEDTKITSADDEDLREIKTALANGNVLVFSSYVYSWVGAKIQTHPDAPENAKYEGEEIVKYQDGFNGSHSMTLVGYNDNIWVDQNGNNQVDKGEMGAFKIANSWSAEYANKGFCWVAYDALNKVSAVEGGFSGNRGSIMEYFWWITVKPYGRGSDFYVRFTLNTQDRVQMNVDFSAERNGVEETGKFLLGSSYRHEGNRLGFNGTEEAVDGTFCYALDNVSPSLNGENFDDYVFSATFEDTDADGKALMVKKVEVVNSKTGKVYPMSSEPFSVDGEKKTVTLKDAQTTDKTVYYIGFDEPTLHYKRGDGQFTSVKMEYTESRLGHNYRYVIEDSEEPLTLYFTDDKGNKDDNGGKFFTADERLNFYRTKSAREPLAIKGFEYENGLPDINKRSYFIPDVTGGYEPYNFSYTFEYLETGKVYEYGFDYRYDKSMAFRDVGKYKMTIGVMDQTGDVAYYEEVLDIINRPFVFDELSATSQYGSSLFVGENISFYARTEFERIISRGPFKSLYEFVVKDQQGKEVYTETVKSTKYHLGDCVSHVYLNWIPSQKGNYTVTVSSTDDSKDFAQMSMDFTVYDKIFGDSNGDGEVNIKDATAIQKYLAGSELDFVFGEERADCDQNEIITVKDATCIRKLLANMEGACEAGKLIEYIPPQTEPTVPDTQPQTQPVVTEPKPVTENTVTFTNSHKWSGTLYCYYWSDSNKSMTTWPGKAMTNAGTNTYGESLYTFNVPQGATYIIFTNGSAQTVDIPYSGSEVKYYPLSETDSQGHYKVANW